MNRHIPVDLPECFIEFYNELESWQNEQEIRLKQTYTPENISAGKLIGTSNHPLMKIHHFMIDPMQFRSSYLALAELLKVYRRNITEILDQLINTADQLDFEKLPGQLLEANQAYLMDVAEQLGVPGDIFIFTLDHSLRPILRLYAQPFYEEFIHEDFRHWNQATVCPFCGSKSHFSRLRKDDGKRLMFCDRCFTEWESLSLYCVHCGNDEPHTIKYLSVENDNAYQIYYCEKCKGYLKTYDERETGVTTDLFIADIETIYLDMLAQQKGYVAHDNDEP